MRFLGPIRSHGAQIYPKLKPSSTRFHPSGAFVPVYRPNAAPKPNNKYKAHNVLSSFMRSLVS